MNDRLYYDENVSGLIQRDKVLAAVLALGLGASIGVVVALLFAPQSGDKTRRKLGKQLNTTVDKGRDTAETASEQLRENVTKARDSIGVRFRTLAG